MINPIISAQVAERLNEKVQSTIDSRLFLFCNYSPVQFSLLGEDGAYFLAIQDLYKLAVDTCPVLKKLHIILPKRLSYAFDDLKDIIGQIEMLRSVLDHNQSALNGLEQKKRVDEYLVWQKSILHTDASPSTKDDYARLCAELEKVAKVFLQEVERLVDTVAALPPYEKEDTVRKWVDCSIEWYGGNTKTEIYKGILTNLYISKAQAVNPYFLDNLKSEYDLSRKVSSWIDEMMTDYVSGGTTMVRKDRVKQFYNTLKSMLRETFDELVDEEEEFTLLPQDFLYLDAEIRFDHLPSPENDW